MKHLLWVVGLAALIPAFIFFSKFFGSQPEENKHYLLYAGGFFLVALVCLGVFFYKKFHEEGQQDISITKF
ncbi:MAG TPA: hypothetical protein VJH03_19470 [Blastocatellia bacterium]|nr:hypothetical protein [Blastocatellia bacterium]